MPIWLSETQVRALLPLDTLASAMASALAAFSTGAAVQPVRTVIEASHGAFFASMPALVHSPAAMGAKLVTVFPSNAARGLPTHLATILLLDPETGAALAVMDGRYITEMRTAAVSAASLLHLARPNPRVLAILGSGVQAASHLEMLRRAAPFEDIRCWSPTPAHRDRFAAGHPHVRACATAEEAVRGAGVIAIATSSPTPVLRSDWVAPGAHVIAVGACRPHEREIDPILLARARLFVDSRQAALQESGDIVLGIRDGHFDESHILAELGEVVAKTKPGRASADDITVFKSLGLAVEDVAAAQLVYARALAAGAGVELA